MIADVGPKGRSLAAVVRVGGVAVSGGFGTTVAAGLLVATLAVAVVRPRGLPEAVGAVPAAVLAVAFGVLPLSDAVGEVRALAPTVGFLAMVLLLAELCDRAGLFAAAGVRLVVASRGRPVRFLGLVFMFGSVVTAVLSLDATVVLLTPVVVGAAARSGLRPRPHVYACSHLANSASLLLPVSNLTNLLAFRASGLSFGRFAALMAGPWLAVLAVEYAVFRLFSASDLQPLHGGSKPAAADRGDGARRVAVYPMVVLGLTLAGFAAASLVGVDPAAVAAAGVVALAVPALWRRRISPRSLLSAAAVPFLAFVFGLGVVVRSVEDSGLGRLVPRVVPHATTLPALLVVALVAAALANLINNLPAVLVLLPSVAAVGPPVVLATLIGVNVGPNLTYVGSLATLLWKRLLREREVEATQAEFLRLGAFSVPAGLAVATLALWMAVKVIGA